MTDPITDMLNRLRNAQAVGHETAEVPYAKLKQKIAEILVKEGLLAKLERRRKKGKKFLELHLKYHTDHTPVISGLKRISKPSQRVYKKAKEMTKVRGGYGIVIVSTPQGLMTNQEARKRKLGGEIICEIW